MGLKRKGCVDPVILSTDGMHFIEYRHDFFNDQHSPMSSVGRREEPVGDYAEDARHYLNLLQRLVKAIGFFTFVALNIRSTEVAIKSIKMKQYLQRQIPKFYYLRKCFGTKGFTLLDIGSGNHSASKTTRLFPNCTYHGVDLQKDFNNDETDYASMADFFEMDLTLLDFDKIPDNYYDFIRMAHVIEHLHNGDKVILGLLPKLNGRVYLY